MPGVNFSLNLLIILQPAAAGLQEAPQKAAWVGPVWDLFFYSAIFSVVAFIALLALTLVNALAVSGPLMVIRWLYRSGVRRWMAQRGGEAEEGVGAGRPPSSPSPPPRAELRLEVLDSRAPDGSPAGGAHLYRRAVRASHSVANAYAAAGVAYAAAMTPLLVLSIDRVGLNIPVASLAVGCFAMLLWLPLLSYVTVAAGWLRKLLLLMADYLLVVAACAAAGGLAPPQGGESVGLASLPLLAFFFWFLFMTLPTSTLIIMRQAGVAGLIVGTALSVLLFALSFYLILFPEIISPGSKPQLAEGLLRHRGLLWLAVAVVTVALVVTLFVMVGRRYERKKFSDQMMLLENFMAFTTIWVAILSYSVIGWYAALAALPFALHRLVARAWLRRRKAAGGERAVSLMLLRVFGSKRRSEWLLNRLSYYWRYIGSIQLIGAPDLATANLELHELLSFATGRLKNRFLKNGADRTRQLDALDLAPDPDGRYRVNEFFCQEDIWRGTVKELLKRSDAVLMDLRGFSPANRGCVDELSDLVNIVPVNRLVITADGKTDFAFLRDTLFRAWAEMAPDSPNYALRDPTLRILYIHRQNGRAVKRLLSLLDEAAVAPKVLPGQKAPTPAPPAAAELRA
jgi:hypothetical protein